MDYENKIGLGRYISTFGNEVLIMDVVCYSETRDGYKYCFEILGKNQKKIAEFGLDDINVRVLRDIIDAYSLDKEREKIRRT